MAGYPGGERHGKITTHQHFHEHTGAKQGTSPGGQPLTEAAEERAEHGNPSHYSDASKHPGFKAVQSKIAAKEGISQDRAGAILAASSRHASAGAKKANPRLKRVKG